MVTTKKTATPANSIVPATKTPAAKKTTGVARAVKNEIPIGKSVVNVYASPKILTALNDIAKDMTLYHGVKLEQVIEAVYDQGKKDGARNAIEKIQESVRQTVDVIPHLNPGRPKAARKKLKK